MTATTQLSTIEADLKTTALVPAALPSDVVRVITSQTWSPLLWADGRQKGSSFIGSFYLVYDIDEGMTLNEAVSLVAEKGLWAVVATTRNHQKKKNGRVGDRFRVVLRLERYVESWDDYRATWDHWRANLFSTADTAAGLVTQIFFASLQAVVCQEGDGLAIVEGLPAKKPQNVLEGKFGSLMGIKGKLARSTLEFLSLGAEDGEWNKKLFSAARDASEQGYDQQEFIDLATKVTGYLDSSDFSTISSAYKYEPGNEVRASEADIEAVEKSYSLFDELSNVKDFLSNPKNTKGISTGFSELDRRLGFGLLPRYFMGLTAPGKTGKTTFITQLMYNIAKQGTKVGVMSLEMSPFRSLIPSLLSIGYERNVRIMSAEQSRKIIEAVPETLPFLNNINFCRQMGVTKPELLTSYIKYQYEYFGAEVFFLDHVGYSLEDISDRKQHSNLSKALRKVCDDLPIHLLAIIQPKGLEYNYAAGRQRASKSTLYGGATWGQDLSQLAVLDRDPKLPNTTQIYLTDSHNPMADTSETDPIILKYDRETNSLKE